MTGLSDMEELLSRIYNKAMVDYMREAVCCYHVGAYRGCIVLSYIALFDDLSEKLHELAKTNSTAKKISKDVKQRQNDQQIFETYMVDQLKSNGLITEAEASALNQVRVCRNKAAHPSGVHASPEEARFVFFEVIDKFLSEKLLLTTQAVDALMGRLENANFFPTNDIKEAKSIVESELENLHNTAFPNLVDRLVGACSGANQTLASNAQRFLVGLSHLQQATVTTHVRKRLVKAKADDTAFRKVIVRVISANADVLKEQSAPTIARIRALLSVAVDEMKPSVAVTQFSHPVRVLNSMLQGLGEQDLMDAYGEVAEKIVQKYRYTGSLVKLLPSSPQLTKVWLLKIKEEAGSSNFELANRFAKSAPEIDDQLADLLKPKDAFELVVSVSKAADVGAYNSKDLRNAHFEAVPNLRNAAIEFAEGNVEEAEHIVEKAGLGEDLEEFIEAYLGDG